MLHSIVEAQLLNNVDERSQHEADQIQQGLQNLTTYAGNLAKNDLLINGLIDFEGRMVYLPIFFHSLRLPVDSSASAFLVDYKGRSIVSSTFDAALPSFTSLTIDQQSLTLDPQGLIIIEPVYVHNLIEGAIVLYYPPSSFSKLFGTSTFRHDFFLINSTGIVAYSTDTDLAPVNQTEPVIPTDSWLQVRTKLPQSGLSVVVASSLDIAFKPLKTVQLVLLVGLLVFLVISIGLVIMSVFIVSRPLKSIAAGISAIEKTDDLVHQLDTRGPDEIAEIATTFNRMANWLRSSMVSRDLMDNILESVTEGIITIDNKGLIMTNNIAVARMFGYDSTELIGQNISMLVPPDQREQHHSYVASTRIHSPRVIGKNRHMQGCRRNGSLFSMELVVTRLTKDAGSGFVGTIRDITERKTIEENLALRSQELQRTNAELERFVYVASHDLKAPMRGIDNLATMIEEDLQGTLDEDVKDNLSLLRGRVHRMEDLLDGLLEYSRIGRVATMPETIDSHQIILDIVDLLALPGGFTVDMPEPMPTLSTEKASFEQVMRNLINNAVKHHDQDDGCIIISGTKSNGVCEFSISDDGPGIDPIFHERVFRMFQTLRSRDQVEGSGMGLALVKKEVELHGGSVQIISHSEGRGTTFQFTWKEELYLATDINYALAAS